MNIPPRISDNFGMQTKTQNVCLKNALMKTACLLGASVIIPALSDRVLFATDSFLFKIVLIISFFYLLCNDANGALVLLIVVLALESEKVLRIAQDWPVENFNAVVDGDMRLTEVLPACVNVKLEDIRKGLNLSDDKIANILINLGVSPNLELNDDNAPLFATHLVGAGFAVVDNCAPPKGNPAFVGKSCDC